MLVEMSVRVTVLIVCTHSDQCKEPQSQLSQLVEKKSDNEAKLQLISLADIDEVWSLPRYLVIVGGSTCM